MSCSGSDTVLVTMLQWLVCNALESEDTGANKYQLFLTVLWVSYLQA